MLKNTKGICQMLIGGKIEFSEGILDIGLQSLTYYLSYDIVMIIS